jgi:hypothetical protein
MKVEVLGTVASVSEFIKLLDSNDYAFFNYIFRGHSNEQWGLIPKLFRNEYAGTNYHHKTVKTFELMIMDEFKQRAYPYLTDFGISSYTDYMKILYIAQHHGLPTRLLDFSTNPLIALYFACLGKENSNKYGAVWFAIKEQFLVKQNIYEEVNKYFASGYLDDDPLQFEKPVCLETEFLITRMTNQASTFLIWGNNPKSLLEYTEFQLYKIMIDHYSKERILNELEKLDIHKASVFSGLDKLGEFVDEKYRKQIKRFLPPINM